MSAQKKQPKIVGLLGKTRDELSATGPTVWMSLFPGSKRNESGEWVPDGSRPFKVLFVQKGMKLWLNAIDVKVFLKLIEENKEDVEAGFAIAGVELEDRLEQQKKLLEA
jgi:hypothetical protein